jgi:outer membrane protein insertion porin family
VYVRKRLIELIEARLSYRLESVDIFNIAPQFIGPIGDLAGETRISKVGLRLLRDTRNNLITPTRGSRLEAFGEVAGGPFGGDVNYYKLESRVAQYFPLFQVQNQVIEVQGRLGTAKEFGDSLTVPFFDRFFLGGQDSLRGFEYREVGPKTVFGEPTGGKSYGYFTFEYSLALAGQVRAAFFYDGGFVNRGSFDFNPSGYNDNYGFGIRFMMLGQPMRIDYGIPITTDPLNDRGAQFNFSFGSRF